MPIYCLYTVVVPIYCLYTAVMPIYCLKTVAMPDLQKAIHVSVIFFFIMRYFFFFFIFSIFVCISTHILRHFKGIFTHFFWHVSVPFLGGKNCVCAIGGLPSACCVSLGRERQNIHCASEMYYRASLSDIHLRR